MINNRQQSGRRRGRGGQRQNGGGQGNGRSGDTGNRIDNRSRGNAAQLLEKYKTLARDAQQAGDRVLAEYYFQFADHYFRVLAETRARYEEANPNRRPQGDFAEGGESDGYDDGDGDGSDEGDNFGEFDAPRDQRPQQQPQQRPYRDDRPQRDDRAQRDERPARDERVARDERAPRDERTPRDERPAREERPRRTENRDRPRDTYAQANKARAANSAGRNDASDHDGDEGDNALPFDALPPAIGISTASTPDIAPDLPVGIEGEPVPTPRKRGRPRKVVAETPVEG